MGLHFAFTFRTPLHDGCQTEHTRQDPISVYQVHLALFHANAVLFLSATGSQPIESLDAAALSWATLCRCRCWSPGQSLGERTAGWQGEGMCQKLVRSVPMAAEGNSGEPHVKGSQILTASAMRHSLFECLSSCKKLVGHCLSTSCIELQAKEATLPPMKMKPDVRGSWLGPLSFSGDPQTSGSSC